MEPNTSLRIDTSIFASTQVKPASRVLSFGSVMGALVVIALFFPASAFTSTIPHADAGGSDKVDISQSRGRGPAQRIKFAIGAISAHITGQFTPAHERARYVIKARAGDHMILNIIPVTKMLTMGGTVKSPSGEGDGGPGGIIMNADLTETGDYTIEVFQHTMGSNLASGKFILEVVITPAWLKS